MQTFKEKMKSYYPSDAQSRVAHHFMERDPSRHGMKEEDMTHPREGVPPNRRFKTGGHVQDEVESVISPTAAIGKRVNEAYQRTSHKHGGSIRSQKGLPDIKEDPACGPTAGHKKEGGSMKRDLGGFIQGAAQKLGNAAGMVTKPARDAMGSFNQGFQTAKKGGSMKTVKHVHTHRHYDAGGNVNPDKSVPSDIGLNPSPKTSREQYDAQRGTKPIYRAMGGAGKVRKGVMNTLGQQMTS